jgi:hypothetical protein
VRLGGATWCLFEVIPMIPPGPPQAALVHSFVYSMAACVPLTVYVYKGKEAGQDGFPTTRRASTSTASRYYISRIPSQSLIAR